MPTSRLNPPFSTTAHESQCDAIPQITGTTDFQAAATRNAVGTRRLLGGVPTVGFRVAEAMAARAMRNEGRAPLGPCAAWAVRHADRAPLGPCAAQTVRRADRARKLTLEAVTVIGCQRSTRANATAARLPTRATRLTRAAW